MTGKAGYYRRKQEESKTVEKAVTIHEGEAELDDQAASNMFGMAIKQTQPHTECAFNANDLPFFRARWNDAAGNVVFAEKSLPVPVAASQRALVADEGSAAHASSSDPSNLPGPMANVAEVEHADEGDDEDDVTMTGGSLSTFYDWALPKSKAGAKAKTAPKPKPASAKPKAKAKAKTEDDSTKNRKRKTDSLVQDLESLVKVPRSSGSDTSADKAIVDSFAKPLMDTRKTLFLCETDTDAAITECLKNAVKKLTTSNQLIKAKMKSLGRRTSSETEWVLSELDNISAEVGDAQKIAQSLLACSGEDTDLVDSMKDMTCWLFSYPLYKRALKGAVISNMKFLDWPALTSSTRTRMQSQLGTDAGADFFWLMINEVTQKLLRAIPTKKVPWISLLEKYVWVGWVCFVVLQLCNVCLFLLI